MTSDRSTAGNRAYDSNAPIVLDGNAAAGEFAGVLASDPTTVVVGCCNCGATQAFGQLKAYMGGPGTVLRCRTCESLVARLAATAQGTWLDLSGSGAWLFPLCPDPRVDDGPSADATLHP